MTIFPYFAIYSEPLCATYASFGGGGSHMCVCMCVCMNMQVGCECNVVIATCPQRYLESTFLRCDNVVKHSQRCHNQNGTLSQRDFVGWVYSSELSMGIRKMYTS